MVDWRRVAHPPAGVAPQRGRRMDKSARIRACLERAGLPRVPPDDTSDLARCGLDSLLAVLTIVELQKEFRVTVPAREVTPATFETIESLSSLIPD